MKPAGSWKGVIETLYSQNEVKTPFYKLTLKLPEKSNFNVFALGGSNIGGRKEISTNVISQISAMFGVDPDCICSEGGSIQLLVGQDSRRSILKPLTKIKGREVSSYMPNIAKDLSLNTSMATISSCGAIG